MRADTQVFSNCSAAFFRCDKAMYGSKNVMRVGQNASIMVGVKLAAALSSFS